MSISGFALPAADPQTPTTIAGLKGRGQAALLEELSSKVDDPASFIRLAAAPLAPMQPAAPLQDNTRFERRIVLSLENRSTGSADRVAFARIRLTLPDGKGHEFVSWNKLQTEFAQIDVAKLKRDDKTTRSLDARFGGSLAGISAEVAPKVSAEQALSEEVALRQRYVALTGSLTSKAAEILQQSVSGVDLTGNVVFDVEVRAGEHDLSPVTVALISNLTDKDGKLTNQDKVSLAFKSVRFADADAAPIEAKMELAYRIRAVTSGDATIVEGDDAVVFAAAEECGKSEPGIVLLTQDELKFTTWILTMNTPQEKYLVAVDRVPGESGVSHPVGIDMESAGAAYEFLSWIADHPSSNDLRLASRKLYRCPWKDVSSDACTPLTRQQARQMTVTDYNWNWTFETTERPVPTS